MWKKGATVKVYESEFKSVREFCNNEMENAIQNFDFERAKVINDAKEATIIEDAQIQDEHYRREQEILKDRAKEELRVVLAENKKEYEHLLEIEKEKLEKEISKTEKRQKIEIRRIINDWRDARSEELLHIHQQIDDLLKEAQDLARNKAFDKAIEKRDYAYELRNRKTFQQLKPIDEVYQAQMDALTARHKREFRDIHDYHKLRVKEIKEKLKSKNACAEAKSKVGEACIPEIIMSTIINQSTNREATLTVLSSVSPRKNRTRNYTKSSFSTTFQ